MKKQVWRTKYYRTLRSVGFLFFSAVLFVVLSVLSVLLGASEEYIGWAFIFLGISTSIILFVPFIWLLCDMISGAYKYKNIHDCISIDQKHLELGSDKILVSGFQKVYLSVDRMIILRTGTDRIVAEAGLTKFNSLQIQQIFTELQKRGKIVEIDPLLDGVFTLEPLQQQKRNRP